LAKSGRKKSLMDGRVEKEQFAVVHRNYLDVFFFTHICSTFFYSVLISDAGVPNVGTPWKNLSILFFPDLG